MSRGLARAALALLLAGVPARAEVAAPDAEPRSYLSPTDEIEPAPRVPPVTQPKPMERTRLGQPADAAPADRATPPPAHVTPPSRRVTEPRRVAAPRRTARKPAATPPRRLARTPVSPDTSLSTIFTQPRSDENAPPRTLAPQAGPSADAPPAPRPMTFNYAPVPPVRDAAPCPTRSRTSLGALFACTR